MVLETEFVQIIESFAAKEDIQVEKKTLSIDGGRHKSLRGGESAWNAPSAQ